jgi:hypothetical protein
MALACVDTWTNASVDLFGLERVHDNALPYKYSFGPGCEVEMVFLGISCMAFAPATGLLFVADCAKLRVLDVGRRTVGTDLLCSGNPVSLACARDVMAVAVWSMERSSCYIEIRQCSGAYTVLRTVVLEPRTMYYAVVGLSTDGTALAVAFNNGRPGLLAIFSTDTGRLVSNTYCHKAADTILYWEDQGWVVAWGGCVQWLRDAPNDPHDPLQPWPVFPTAMFCFKRPAIVPRFGMVWVRVCAWDENERVHLVACPDVVAMRGMGEARVGWMVAVARTALLFP